MIYSKTAKYAVLALAEVASRRERTPVPTREISESSAIPYALLAKIVVQLRRAGLVRADRGKRGGVHLARPADEISVQDVVVAIDGRRVFDDCPLYLDPCDCTRTCSLHPIWKSARDGVVRFLANTTIQAVANARDEQRAEQQVTRATKRPQKR
jgi:Rrf2 family protein